MISNKSYCFLVVETYVCVVRELKKVCFLQSYLNRCRKNFIAVSNLQFVFILPAGHNYKTVQTP